jgi:dihydrofolate reductase
MAQRISIEGYAIVSADGMIADHNREMPPGIEADVRFFADALDAAGIVVHGRNSYEQQAASDRRRRLIVTGSVAKLASHPRFPNAWCWNPEGIAFPDACEAVGIREGTAAITGGPRVFGLFLQIGFEAFHLSRAGKLRLPGGRPVFPQVPKDTRAGIVRSWTGAGPRARTGCGRRRNARHMASQVGRGGWM